MIKVKLASGRPPFDQHGELRNTPGQGYLVNVLMALVPHPRDEALGDRYGLAILENYDLVPDNIMIAVTNEIIDRARDGACYRPSLDQVARLIETAVAMDIAVMETCAALPPPLPPPPPRPVLLSQKQREHRQQKKAELSQRVIARQ